MVLLHGISKLFLKQKIRGKMLYHQKYKKKIQLSIYLHKSPVYKCLGFLDSQD